MPKTVVQCINTWDLSPAKDNFCVYIDGVGYSYIPKKHGYLALERQPPQAFVLRLESRRFLDFNITVERLPADGIILCELVLAHPPFNSVLLNLEPPATVVLGYNYLRLGKSAAPTDRTLTLADRAGLCEGRRFLLRDTASGTEEFVVLGDAQDIALTTFAVPAVYNSYCADTSVMLPSFHVADCSNSPKPIPIQTPTHSAKLWQYRSGIKQLIKI